MESVETSHNEIIKIHDNSEGENVYELPFPEQNPNLHLLGSFITSIANYDWLEALYKQYISDEQELEHDIFLEKLLDTLSGIEEILAEIETMNVNIATQYFEALVQMPIVTLENDQERIQKFESAETLAEAFSEFENINDFVEVFSMIPTDAADLLQAALSCEMAGHPKSAKILKREFTHRMFHKGNELYLLIMMSLTEAIGRKNMVKQAGKNGNDSKHKINRLVKQQAIELYLQGSYHNPRHAAKVLLPEVTKIASNLGSNLEWKNNGFERLYGWLRAANTTQSM